MEALGDLLRWWQTLSQHSRMAYAIVSVIVAVVLGVAVYQGYSGTTAPASTDIAQTQHAPAALHSPSILSLPLPGTTRRRQAEAAQLLESALSCYDYIAATQATFAVDPPETETANSPRLSLQLRFQPAFTLPNNWLDNLVTFVLHTVTGLQPADLLITDSHGEVLYTKGQPTPAAASLTSIHSPSTTPVSESKAAVEIPSVAWGLAALIAVTLPALYLLQAHRRSQQAQPRGETTASRPPQLEQFLSGLTASQITSLAEGERPEVGATILHHVPDPETAAAVRQQMNAPSNSLSEPTGSTREDVLVSFTRALRSKLAARHNNLGIGGDHSE